MVVRSEQRRWVGETACRLPMAAAMACVCLAAQVPSSAASMALNGAEPLQAPAVPSRLAAQSLMLDIARAGTRMVAVGERGRVLLSDDAGASWRQSLGVPVSVTLTAVSFADTTHGWATGHAGVVLHTADAGATWVVQLDGRKAAQLALNAANASTNEAAKRAAQQLVDDGPDKPFLALEFSSPRQGIVVGAYGLIFSTDDGGATWTPRLLEADNPSGLHLNAVRTIGTQTWIVGEKGLVLRAEPGGRYAAVKSPYEGSWFGVDALPGMGVLLAGLRGNAWSSVDGANWQRVPGPADVTLSHVSTEHDRVLLVDQAGAVLGLQDGRLQPLAIKPTPPVTSVALASDGTLVATTLRGPMRLTSNP